MVAILNFVCVGHCTEQTGSFHVKSSLYDLVMGCKIFYNKTVISVQSLKTIHRVAVCIFQQCVALIFWVHVLQMLWSIIYCSSPDGHFEKYYNTHHGRIDVCEFSGQLVREIDD